MSALNDWRDALEDRIYRINEHTFNTVALDVFSYQASGNPVYRTYLRHLGIVPGNVRQVADIPFLPISFFKTHEVQSGEWSPEAIFRSSGTSGQTPSRHLVRSLAWYRRVTELCFPPGLGDPDSHTWIGLLPSYLDRPDSSLVTMVHHFMHIPGASPGMFCLAPDAALTDSLQQLARENRRTLLIGVSFALLDLVEVQGLPVWPELTVMETGGMKGRGPEITREELYDRIRARYPEVRLTSEYGMTELMSQAYRTNGHFHPGPTMRVMGRDVSDPLALIEPGQRGALNIIDLANLDTCAFIATEDTGMVYGDGSFDVSGRLDVAEMRGCNLLYTG